jgi:uncharacterized protein (TIGR03083 family)
MAGTDIWPAITAERLALAADLEALPDARWDTPSLCTGWSVRDVLAHMAATAKIGPASFFGKLLVNGFSFTKLQSKDIAANRGTSPAETLASFKAIVHSTTHPPGPTDTWLGETIVHSEDIRRPLGLQHNYPTEGALRVADFYKGSNLVIGAKKRISGFTLRATDADWTHGDGPEVSGPIVALVMAMAGRKPAIDDLTGEGVEALRARP